VLPLYELLPSSLGFILFFYVVCLFLVVSILCICRIIRDSFCFFSLFIFLSPPFLSPLYRFLLLFRMVVKADGAGEPHLFPICPAWLVYHVYSLLPVLVVGCFELCVEIYREPGKKEGSVSSLEVWVLRFVFRLGARLIGAGVVCIVD